MSKLGNIKNFKKKNMGEQPDGDSRNVHNKNLRDAKEAKRYPKPEKEAERFESDK